MSLLNHPMMALSRLFSRRRPEQPTAEGCLPLTLKPLKRGMPQSWWSLTNVLLAQLKYQRKSKTLSLKSNDMKLNNAPKRKTGFTLLELLITLMVLAIISATAIPIMKNSQRRDKEIELYQTLRQMRDAIDNYKKAVEGGAINPPPAENYGYPESLEILVEGAPKRSGTGSIPFLRKIPTDPITGRTEWSLRSINDDPNSTSWGGGSVFDVRSTAKGTGLNGIPYKDW